MEDSGRDAGHASAEIERQIERLQAVADPATRAIATDLLASVLDLHAAALGRLLRIVESNGVANSFNEALDADDMVRAVLLLHDLHPLSLEERVQAALRRLQSKLEHWSARTEVVSLTEGEVKVIVVCPRGASEEIRELTEAALLNAAPDAAAIHVELAGPRPDFVPIGSIQMAAPASSAAAAKG